MQTVKCQCRGSKLLKVVYIAPVMDLDRDAKSQHRYKYIGKELLVEAFHGNDQFRCRLYLRLFLDPSVLLNSRHTNTF